MFLEEHISQKAQEIRAQFAARNLSYLRIDIEISGRPDSELLVVFKVGESYNSDQACAGSLDAAVKEYFRRKEWSSQNFPLCLPNTQR